jgi:hypothetical protein
LKRKEWTDRTYSDKGPWKIIKKKRFVGKPEGRMMGRPRIRWLEDAEKDNREMKVKIWRQKALNREELGFVFKKSQRISK